MKQKPSAGGEERHSSTAQHLDRALQGTRERVGRAVGQVKEQLGALREKAPDDLRDEAQQLVRQHPGAAVLLAVGAGILLGWMLRGRE
jgi:ElaB/YqjD/DUF883 family membrane-anchored ribosome-binding protein